MSALSRPSSGTVCFTFIVSQCCKEVQNMGIRCWPGCWWVEDDESGVAWRSGTHPLRVHLSTAPIYSSRSQTVRSVSLRPCSHTSTYITSHWTHYFVLARIHQHTLHYIGHITSSLLAYINIYYVTPDTLFHLCSHTLTYIILHWTHYFLSARIHQHTLCHIGHMTSSLLAYINIHNITSDTLLGLTYISLSLHAHSNIK